MHVIISGNPQNFSVEISSEDLEKSAKRRALDAFLIGDDLSTKTSIFRSYVEKFIKQKVTDLTNTI